MAGELGHLSADIALDITPFLNNQRVLESQINRTTKLLKTMEDGFKSGSVGSGTLFKTQITQLGMLEKQLSNFQNKYNAVKKDLAANPTTDNQRALGTVATQLQNTAMKYDQLRMAAARNQQQININNTAFGRLGNAIGDYGNKLQGAAQGVRNFGSSIGSAALGGALFSAAQQSMKFKSEIQQIGPLLSDTGEITASVKKELDSMSSASLKWSQQYGIATTDVNNAMAELVRRGFSAQQTLGSMPAILDASRASGESLGVVMQATASAIEIFGLKANSAEEQLKNTQRVTDVLTMAANKTATSFADISAAMTYVGPTAASAHMSIEQTAAALGMLSNKGIEASTAGTTLRQVISRLTTDTKANRANMQAIGIDIDQIKKKGIDLPNMIEKVNAKLKDKTPTERMALLNQAFGKLGQGVMALFEKSNKGSKSAADELRNLQTELEHAGGTTKRVADEMNKTPEAKWQQFQQTLHALAITIGGNVLPAFTQVMDVIKQVATAFGNLPQGMQQTIVNFGLLYAAIKPLSFMVAAPIDGIGKLMNAFQGLFRLLGATSKVGSFATALSQVDAQVKNLSSVEGAASSLTKLGTEATGAATKTGGLLSKLGGLVTGGAAAASATEEVAVGAAGAAEGTATLGSALAATATGLGIVAVAAVAAFGAFKLWTDVIQPAIEKQRENAHEMSLWGTVVGKETSNSAEKFRNFAKDAQNSLDDAQNGVHGSGEKIKKDFQGMADEAERAAKKTQDAFSKVSKETGGVTGAYLDSVKNDRKKKDQSYLDTINKDIKLASQIIDESSKNGKRMSSDTRTVLDNLQDEIATNFVKTLNVSQKSSAQIQKVITGNLKGISRDQASKMEEPMLEAIQQTYDKTKKGMADIKKLYDEGRISREQYNTAQNLYQNQQDAANEKLLAGYAKVLKAEGMSTKAIRDNLQQTASMYGINSNLIDKALDDIAGKHQKTANVVAKVSSQMSKDAQKAGKDWNSLVLDPKTLKVKSNAQEEVNKAASSAKGWKQLQFDFKHADISTNAKKMIIEAGFASGQWNKMSFKEQKAMILSNSGKVIAQSLQDKKQWNNLKPDIQKLIVEAPNKQTILDGLHDLKKWNELTPEQKKLVISQFSGFDRLTLELQNIKAWNDLKPDQKKLVMNMIKSGGSMEDALRSIGIWNSLPATLQKEIRLQDQATPSIAKVKDGLAGLNNTSANPRINLETSNFFERFNTTNQLMHGLSSAVARPTVDANDQDFNTKYQSINQKLDGINGKTYQSTFTMQMRGMQDMKKGVDLQGTFNKTPASSKNNKMSNTGASQVQDGTNKQKAFNGISATSKNNHMSTSGREQVQDGTNKQKNFNGTHSSSKSNSIHTSGIGQLKDAIDAMVHWSQQRGHDIVNHVTTFFENVGKAITGKHANGTTGAWRVNHFAYGTPSDGFAGGLSWVGDGGRKEVVYQPQSRALFTTPATPTLMNLEKGSIVWRSVEAFERAMRHAGINQYPKFAEGTAGANLIAYANRIPADVDNQIRQMSSKFGQKDVNNNDLKNLLMQQNELIAMLIQQNQELAENIKNLAFSFNVNGQNLANATAEDNAKAINTYIRKSGFKFS